MARMEAMGGTEPSFDPFTGPIVDRSGNEVYAEGDVAPLGELMGLEWAADNVVGDWDNEP